MCSWCWGFRPCWQTLRTMLPQNIQVQYLVGGLAPDSDDPMPEAMQQYLQNTWRKIQHTIPGTVFNFDFWQQCQPRRSTYPACRAMIAAQALGQYQAMWHAIQAGYYLHAKNPSDNAVLITLAVSCGMDQQAFAEQLTSAQTEAELQTQIRMSQMMAQGFPSLVLLNPERQKAVGIAVHYTDPQAILRDITLAMAQLS